MQAHIENLVKLQAVDLERARLTLAVRALPAEIAQAQAALTAAESQSAEASDALNREESLRTRMEREIAGHRQKAARFKVQLDSVTTPAQAEAIEHEIRFVSSEADRLENEEFASLERTEAQEAALAEARSQVESQAAALEKTRARVRLRQQEYTAELATLNTEREALRQLATVAAACSIGIQHWHRRPKRRRQSLCRELDERSAKPAKPAPDRMRVY
jgi:predicted  nucleic acid-binding Zn-ribbon protein